jgi:hypothetical protein
MICLTGSGIWGEAQAQTGMQQSKARQELNSRIDLG